MLDGTLDCRQHFLFSLCWQCLTVILFLSFTDMWEHVIYTHLAPLLQIQTGRGTVRASCWLSLCWWICCSSTIKLTGLIPLHLEDAWKAMSKTHLVIAVIGSYNPCKIQISRTQRNQWMTPSEQSVRIKRGGGRLDWETKDMVSADDYWLAVFCTVWDVVCLCSLERQLTLF